MDIDLADLERSPKLSSTPWQLSPRAPHGFNEKSEPPDTHQQHTGENPYAHAPIEHSTSALDH